MRLREEQRIEGSGLAVAGGRLVVAQLHRPVSVERLPEKTQTRLAELEGKLSHCLLLPSPTYEQLGPFAHQHKVDVRPEIGRAIRSRDVPHSISSERSAAERFQRDHARFRHASIYGVAREIRAAVFGHVEPMRTEFLTISYLPWIRLAPPKAGDPLYTAIRALESGSPILDALNLFLILLSAHPFSDGNGRTARILLNVYLSRRDQMMLHYLPIAELVRAGNGALEELLARGCVCGDYTPALSYLIDLLDAYVDYRALVETNTRTQPLDQLQSYLESPGQARQGEGRQYDLNKIPPFLIAVQDLAGPIGARPVNHTFIAAINRFASALAQYGSVIFAITTLEDLTDENSQRSVTFFINSTRKEELLLRYRQMRCAERDIDNLELALWLDEPILNAKVLINLTNFYYEGTRKATVVLLHGFPQERGAYRNEINTR
jgi:hypothetical protein